MADDRTAVGLHTDALEVDLAQELVEAGVRAQLLRQALARLVAALRAKPNPLHLHNASAASREATRRGQHRLIGRKLEAVVAAEDPPVARELETQSYSAGGRGNTRS